MGNSFESSVDSWYTRTIQKKQAGYGPKPFG